MSVQTWSRCGISLLVLVFAVLLSYSPFSVKLFSKKQLDNKLFTSSKLVDIWNQQIQKSIGGLDFNRIAVGVNGDVDIILQGTDLFKELSTSANSSKVHPKDHAVITNIEELDEIFTLFLSKGGGGERFFSNFGEFQKVIEASRSVQRVKKFVGGNAALIAQKILELNKSVKVMVGLPVGPVLDLLLNPSVERLKSETTSLKMDEYHVVLEYSKSEIWNGLKAPASSRFIFSHDVSNSHMSCFHDFVASLPDFSPDLVVISGLHMLEGIDWEGRLMEITEEFKQIPRSAAIHVELASMAGSKFVNALIQKILPQVDSIGLNEQELWLLCHSLGFERCKGSLQPNIPITVEVAVDMITLLLEHLDTSAASTLSRIHFHTLSFHIIASKHSSTWNNQLTAVCAGARQAALQACGGNLGTDYVDLGVQPGDTELITSDQLTRTLKAAGVTFHITPSLICRKPLQTVGLGDAISASGLLYSRYS